MTRFYKNINGTQRWRQWGKHHWNSYRCVSHARQTCTISTIQRSSINNAQSPRLWTSQCQTSFGLEIIRQQIFQRGHRFFVTLRGVRPMHRSVRASVFEVHAAAGWGQLYPSDQNQLYHTSILSKIRDLSDNKNWWTMLFKCLSLNVDRLFSNFYPASYLH